MKLLFDEDLVEAVVFLLPLREIEDKRVPPPQIGRFHREREKLYAILDPDARNTAFFRLHLEWFREWEQEKLLVAIINQFPCLGQRLEVIAFRKARNKGEEGAELYVNNDRQRHGIVALRPERFRAEAELVCFLHRELQHLSDMVDPAFGYSREINVSGQTPSRQRLVRDRYRLLWDIVVDGRLTARGLDTSPNREQREAEFNRAYNFLPDEKRAHIFASLWNNRAPRHLELLHLASDPRELESPIQQATGAPCPLCGFATFHWADLDALASNLVGRVQHEFPAWTTEQGLCARCAAVYRAALQSAIS